MLEQLRFNISEKIRLHPQQAGISSLLELDLYPDVEIKEEGQHVKIHGYLRLNGTYEGEFYEEEDREYEEFDGEAIAYVIPVEITLPRERAQLIDVSAEVESFDYQVLSPFELQIEAVLLIDGILPEQEEAEIVTEISEEEQTKFEDFPSFAAQPAEAELEQKSEPIEEPTEEVVAPVIEQQEEPVIEEAKQEESVQQPVVVEEETPPVAEDEEQSETSFPSSGKWSSWLVNGQDEHFVPIKMVIVQADDSIDTLAEKYEISSDAIIRTNEFITDRLVAGQIVKIPVKRS